MSPFPWQLWQADQVEQQPPDGPADVTRRGLFFVLLSGRYGDITWSYVDWHVVSGKWDVLCLFLCVSVSQSLLLSVCLPPRSLPDVHSELWKCWTFSSFILQDTSTTPVARPTGTLRCTGEPVDNQGAGLSSCTKSQAKISQLQLLCWDLPAHRVK